MDPHRQWLDLDAIALVGPDQAVYADWRNSMRSAMVEEIERMVLRVEVDERGTLADLLTTRVTEVDPDLALLYGLEEPEDWQRVELDGSQRAGVLTTPGWLAATSHAVDPSPVLRGVFVLDRLLCHPPAPPPASVDTTPPEADTGEPATNRDRYAQHTTDPACAACHVAIDGIGFGFESYDATGRWRDEDGGKPVDASGTLVGTDVDGAFVGAPALANLLARSDTVHTCVATRWTEYALGRRLAAADACATEPFLAAYRPEVALEDLAIAIVRSDTFRYRGLP
jgi:hypothetical protein